MATIIKTAEGNKYTAFAIKGTRWFSSNYGNTTHVAYVSGLCAETGKWVELGKSDETYGYGDHFQHTGGCVLLDLGLFESEESNEEAGYMFCRWGVREQYSIETYAVDVKRKRDL